VLADEAGVARVGARAAPPDIGAAIGAAARLSLTLVSTPQGRVTTYTYDTTGRRLTAVAPKDNVTGGDPAAFTTRYAYDAAGRLLSTSVADPAGAQVSAQTYDADGRLATQTDPLGKVTRYTYDLAGRLTVLTRPDGSTQQTTYFADGVVGTQTDGLGKVTTYTEDALDRFASVTDRWDGSARPRTTRSTRC
jgi:YD repeat-containing protein